MRDERKLSFASMAMWARRRVDERECQRQPLDAISGKGGCQLPWSKEDQDSMK